MTKTSKKPLVIIVLTLLCVACLCLFAACEPTPQDNAVTYTVTVKTDETTPASGVKVTIKKGGAIYGTAQVTGEDGKATFELNPDSYEIALADLPAHYELPSDAALTLTADNREQTVTLARKFAYEVKLVNAADETPYYAEGVEVMICTLSGTCLQPVALEANGVALIEEDKSDYHVKVQGLKNAAYVCDEDGYYSGEGKDLSATKTSTTIKLYPATDVESVTPMTEEEKAAFAAQNDDVDENSTLYKHTVKLAAGATAYYSITPEFNCQYKIHHDLNASYQSYLYSGTAFKLGNVGNSLPTIINLRAGNTYYFNLTNTDEEEQDIEFVAEAPTASYDTINKSGTVNVTIGQENAKAVIMLTTDTKSDVEVAYKATVTGENTAIKYTTNLKEVAFEDSDYNKNSSCSFRVVNSMVYIVVSVKNADKYPVTLKVSIENLGEIKDTYDVKHVTGLTDYADQVGRLKYVPVDGTVEAVYNEGDGYYHMGDENGPVIVVKLTKPINDGDRFNSLSALTALEIGPYGMAGFNPFTVDVTSEEDKADLTKGNSYVDYRVMLRGFGDYEDNYQIPTITEPDYYSKHVNKNGCYPLTKDLKAALEAVVAYDKENMLMPLDAVPGYEWLFACYYYDENDLLDPIECDYDLVSFTVDGETYKVGDEYQDFMMEEPATVTVDSIDLIITKGAFTITDNYSLIWIEINGKWTNTDGTYKFTVTKYQQNPDTYEMEEVDVEVTSSVNVETGVITITYENEDEGITYSFTFKKAAEDEE